MDRFSRQTILPGFGNSGQDKLRNASVLVIGAGGLGCPALSYLCAAGVGTIGIVDGDVVETSNLNRQILFGLKDLGKNKAACAGEKLQSQYPDVRFNIYPYMLTNVSSLQTFQEYDVILDGSDNFPTRYLVNDACYLLQKPLSTGAVFQNEGQFIFFCPPETDGYYVNYRDVFPLQPPAGEVPDCNQAGVLGVLPGLIGIYMASETIKYLSGFGRLNAQKMHVYHWNSHSLVDFEILPNPKARMHLPEDRDVYINRDYGKNCVAGSEISWNEAIQHRSIDPAKTALVDVREVHELPDSILLNCIKLPLSQLDEEYQKLNSFQNIYVFCQTGQRSQYAMKQLMLSYPEKTIYSIQGGIMHPESSLKSVN